MADVRNGRRSGRRSMLVVSLSALLLATGCTTVNTTSSAGERGRLASDSRSSARQHPMLEGIPFPPGFRMVKERSNSWSSGQIRFAQCEFEGSDQPERVARFYIDNMTSARFTLRQKAIERGEFVLRFSSNTEEANLRTWRDGSKTRLYVDLKPLPKGSAVREIEPVTPQNY